MDVSMTLPTMLPHGRDEVLAWCRATDEGPWASLAVPERITYTSHESTVQLAAAAALTERVRLWTTIVILPAHDAVAVAKQMASVDVLSAGRLTVGLGVGGREHDYRAVSAPFDHRWQRMDEQVVTMRRIWAGEPPFEGADPVGPPPVQPGGPPAGRGFDGAQGDRGAARWAIGVDGAFTLDGDLGAVHGGVRHDPHRVDRRRPHGRAPLLDEHLVRGSVPVRRSGSALLVRLHEALRRGRRQVGRRERCVPHARGAAARARQRAAKPAPTSSSSSRRPSTPTSSTARATRSGSEPVVSRW